MKQFKQLRFCALNSEYNEPAVTNEDELTKLWFSGEVFTDYLPILRLGIIAPPGTKFFVNGSDNYAVVGYTGLFEIDFEGSGSIGMLSFAKDSLNFIKNNVNASLVVDLIYEGGSN